MRPGELIMPMVDLGLPAFSPLAALRRIQEREAAGFVSISDLAAPVVEPLPAIVDKLTSSQKPILFALRDYYRKHGRGLTCAEVWLRTRIDSKSTVHSALNALERKGLVRTLLGGACRYVPVLS